MVVNVLDPADNYKERNINNSIISIWKQESYEMQKFYSRIREYNAEIVELNVKVKDLIESINKLINAMYSLITLIGLIKEANNVNK